MVSHQERAVLNERGKWDWFVLRRDELKKQGYAPDVAQGMAYEEALGSPVEVAPVVAGAEQKSVEAGGGEIIGSPPMEPKFADDVDMIRAARWVVQALALPNLKVSDAPSLAAWSLLTWARISKDDFFKNHAVKLYPKQEADMGESLRADGRKQIALAERLMKEILERQCETTRRGESENTARSA